jgi:hypothetical protein
MCQNYRNIFNIRVVSLSLGAQHNGSLDAKADRVIGNTVEGARRAGLSVVAAAGNHPGPVDWPAAYPAVLAVGAANAGGSRCSFAASGPEVDLWAMGCPADIALVDGRAGWASGSSEATALIAVALTQLRGLRPDLGVAEAEELFTGTAAKSEAGTTLDVAAAFHSAGLSQRLVEGHRAIPNLASTVPSGGGASPEPATAPLPALPGVAIPPRPDAQLLIDDTPRTALVKPRLLFVRHRDGELTLMFKRKPADVVARIQIYARMTSRAFPILVRTVRTAGDRLRTRVSGTISQLSITYVDPRGQHTTSSPLNVRP